MFIITEAPNFIASLMLALSCSSLLKPLIPNLNTSNLACFKLRNCFLLSLFSSSSAVLSSSDFLRFKFTFFSFSFVFFYLLYII
jgi:hypothetical protein